MGILIFTAKYCSEQDLNQVLKLMTINNIHQGIYNIVSLTATNSEISGILTATISRAIYSPPTFRYHLAPVRVSALFKTEKTQTCPSNPNFIRPHFTKVFSVLLFESADIL